MKNIWNDPRSLFNGNHFSSIIIGERSEPLSRVFNDPTRGIIGERAKRARRYLVMFMETRDIYILIPWLNVVTAENV